MQHGVLIAFLGILDLAWRTSTREDLSGQYVCLEEGVNHSGLARVKHTHYRHLESLPGNTLSQLPDQDSRLILQLNPYVLQATKQIHKTALPQPESLKLISWVFVLLIHCVSPTA
jgi:hypothetical protein